MPFEMFMEACLYDPDDGFFGSGPLRSEKAGDFLTSPEVSPWFGRTIARFVEAERERLGDPADFAVVDVGAGSGSLLESLSGSITPPVVTVWALDASPAARVRLGERFGGERVGAGLDQLPGSVTGVVVANELLDNLPASLAVRTESGWEERWVGIDGDGLALMAAPCRPEVAAWADRFGGVVPEGGMVEVQLAAVDWLRAALSRLEAGALLLFDYGGTAEELEPRRTQGTLRTYRAHHLGPDPLVEPGATDITVDVNFTALLAVVAETGVEAELLRQDDFLSAWGLRKEISKTRRRELDLARDGDPITRLQSRSDRTDAETLLHPRGLGDFRVLVARKT